MQFTPSSFCTFIFLHSKVFGWFPGRSYISQSFVLTANRVKLSPIINKPVLISVVASVFDTVA